MVRSWSLESCRSNRLRFGDPAPELTQPCRTLLVVISEVISPLIWVITTVTLLITPLITTHEPPSEA